MAKREMTAREAKQNLEPFGYKGPAKWASIDAFVEANPRAKAAVTANKGMFVQSEALGFAQGGAVEPSEEAIKKLADLQYLSYKTGVSTEEFRAAKEAVGINPDHMTFDENKRDEYDPNAVTDLLAKYGYTNSGNPLEFYGDNKATDPVANAFVEKDKQKGTSINNNAANKLFAEQVMADQGITADQTSYVTVGEMGMTLDDLKKGYQSSIQIANDAWGNSGYEPEGTDILDTVYSPTKPKPDPTPTTPLPTSIPITPNPQEVEQAKKIFGADGKVTLPTGYEQPVQKMVMPQPFQPTSPVAGVTTAQAQTFGNNQGQQFAKRAIDQAQLIQPQTLAEKTAAGIAPTIQQRLYRNPQGMTTYVTGTVSPDGKFSPTTPVPQGYTQAQQMQTGGVATQKFTIPKVGVEASGEKKESVIEGQPPVITQPYYPSVTPEEITTPIYTPPTVSTDSKNPTVNVGGQQLTKEQVAQGQADLTAGAVLNPAGTVAAAPVANINPDASGTVLSATTGQALGTAPIVTTPAQVSTAATADKPSDAKATTADLQKAQTSVTAALEGGLDPQLMIDSVDGIGDANYDPKTGKIKIKQQIAVPISPGEDPKFETIEQEVTPEQFANQYGLNTKDFTSGGVQAATSTGPTKKVVGQTKTDTAVSDLDAAQIDQAQTVKEIDDRKLEAGETVSGSAVDQTKVGEAFGTGEVKAASVQDELTTLMGQFEGGNTPSWAAGAMRKANMLMASRGLGASSMAGQAVIQAAMEAALPIAQIDTANKQQMALAKAEQRAKFLQQDFDQAFQAKVINASKVSEIANMNFNADQQVALENAKMAQTVDLQNLNNKQALVMAEAAQLSQLETQGLSNLQQAQVENAKNFLQIDMANLNNEQQTEIFKAQTIANTILSDTAAANANEQFNASSQMQVDQFNNTMQSQLNQFNSAQLNAMNQFNAGEANAIQKFNSELQAGREQFNAQMYAQIAQANAKWRQDTETINTAAANESNFQYAKDVNGLTNKAIDELWQKERDLMSYSFNAAESAKDRVLSIVLGDKNLEAVRLQLEQKEADAFTENIFDLVFGGFSLFNKS
tara:strand:+ start:1413 stop:4634 length:3222 start_codon:yes stop_codon:yes gene_type:complete